MNLAMPQRSQAHGYGGKRNRKDLSYARRAHDVSACAQIIVAGIARRLMADSTIDRDLTGRFGEQFPRLSCTTSEIET